MATLVTTGQTISTAQRNCCETYIGNLYVVRNRGSALAMYKSTDRGLTWNEVDNSHAPAISGASEPAMCVDKHIDSNAVKQYLHVHWQQGVIAPAINEGLNYVTFDTTNDLWGTASTIVNIAPIADTYRGVSNAVDSNGKVHVAWWQVQSQRGGNASVLRYSTNVTGSWTNVIVQQVGGSDVFRGNIMLDDDIIPHIGYQVSAFLSITADVRRAIGNQNGATSFTLTSGLGTAIRDTKVYLINDGYDAINGGDIWLFYRTSTNGGRVQVTKFHQTLSSSSWSAAVKALGNNIVDFSASKNGAYIYVLGVDTSGDVYACWTSGDSGSVAGTSASWASSKYQQQDWVDLKNNISLSEGKLIVNVLHYWGTYFNYDYPVVLNILLGTDFGSIGITQDVYYTNFMVHRQYPKSIR